MSEPHLLAPGTVVSDRLVPAGHTRRGVVQPYEPEWSRGTFPVRFDDGIWRLRTGDEVSVVRTGDRNGRTAPKRDGAPAPMDTGTLC